MNDLSKILHQTSVRAEKSIVWLERSLKVARTAKVLNPADEATADIFELLSSRFSRSTDILTTRLWRTLDAVETEEPGSLIDVIHRAHKRGIIEDPEKIKRARELRNLISHEYDDEALIGLWTEILQLAPCVCDAVRGTLKYAKEKNLMVAGTNGACELR